MNSLIRSTVCGLLIAGVAVPTLADAGADHTSGESRFFQRKDEGWFFYHDPKDEAPKKEAAPKTEKKNTPSPFSVAWLREKMPKLLDAAIDDPTTENVEAYLYAQRVTMDKSQRYAEKTQAVVAADPYLDENNRVPLSEFAKGFFLRSHGAAKEEALKYLASIGGLWVFFDSKCDFCLPQTQVVGKLADKHGFITKFVSMDGKGLPSTPKFVRNRGQAQMLKLSLTPTTVFVVPPSTYFVVSQGMMAQDQLEDRLIVAAQTGDLLPAALNKKLALYDRGVLQTEDMREGASDDPKEWIKNLKDKLKGQY